MNNLLKLVLVISVIYGCYKWVNSNDALNESDWVMHQFTLLNIKASFPLKPRVNSSNVDGGKIEFATIHESKNQYFVSIVKGNDFNRDAMYPYSLTNKGAIIKSEKEIVINGHIGKEYLLSLNGKSVIQHFIKYKGSLITQLSIYKKSDITDMKVDYFFNSLALEL